jgi:hypothetical protein
MSHKSARLPLRFVVERFAIRDDALRENFERIDNFACRMRLQVAALAR